MVPQYEGSTSWEKSTQMEQGMIKTMYKQAKQMVQVEKCTDRDSQIEIEEGKKMENEQTTAC